MKKIQQEKVSGLCSIHLHCEPLTLSRSPYQYHRRYYIIPHPTCIEWSLHDSNIQYMLFDTLFCSPTRPPHTILYIRLYFYFSVFTQQFELESHRLLFFETRNISLFAVLVEEYSIA